MFQWITGVITALGYVGIAALTFLENLVPPIPSELVIPFAGFVAARGDLRLDLVIASASLGSLAGATAWYEIGRRIGERRLRRWVERHGKWLTLTGEDLDRAKGWFERHGAVAVFAGRLVPGVRTLISLPAGFAGMRIMPFLLYSAAGTILWTAVLAWAGAMLQANFTAVRGYVDIVSNMVLAAFALLLVRRYVRCWSSQNAQRATRTHVSSDRRR